MLRLHSIYLWIVHRAVRILLMIHAVAIRVARWIGPPVRTSKKKEFDILLTGTFYSDNWIISHLKPLAMSKHVTCIRMVATTPVPPIEKVEAVYPPLWMIRIIGSVPARLITFLQIAITTRPHFVGGFHLLINGLVALLAGRLAGARSIYFCVGGPREVLNGGIWSENRLFRRLETPDSVVERRLVRAVGSFDMIIAMGKGAIQFFNTKGVETTSYVVSGGMDGIYLRPGDLHRIADLITVCRIGPVKRIDILLETVKCLKNVIPDIKVTIVGDGPLRESLERMALELGLGENVDFVGHQQDVVPWLRSSKIFILTSDSEGLSLALMEAMLCGLPAVVSNVGDLGELVRDGVNGYLVEDRTPTAFAACIIDILTDKERLERFAIAARQEAERYDVRFVCRVWDNILNNSEEKMFREKDMMK